MSTPGLDESGEPHIPEPVEEGGPYTRHAYIGAAVSSQVDEGFRMQGAAVIITVDHDGNNLGAQQ